MDLELGQIRQPSQTVFPTSPDLQQEGVSSHFERAQNQRRASDPHFNVELQNNRRTSDSHINIELQGANITRFTHISQERKLSGKHIGVGLIVVGIAMWIFCASDFECGKEFKFTATILPVIGIALWCCWPNREGRHVNIIRNPRPEAPQLPATEPVSILTAQPAEVNPSAG